jgi:hypothetical protein
MDKSLLDLYADYLISSFGPTTATGLSRLLSSGLSHDKITRFLAGQPMTSAHLWSLVSLCDYFVSSPWCARYRPRKAF